MSCGLEFFSTEVSAAPPKVIAHVPPNELYLNPNIPAKLLVIIITWLYSPIRALASPLGFLNNNLFTGLDF
jgi:hypothetical protein